MRAQLLAGASSRYSALEYSRNRLFRLIYRVANNVHNESRMIGRLDSETSRIREAEDAPGLAASSRHFRDSLLQGTNQERLVRDADSRFRSCLEQPPELSPFRECSPSRVLIELRIIIASTLSRGRAEQVSYLFLRTIVDRDGSCCRLGTSERIP